MLTGPFRKPGDPLAGDAAPRLTGAFSPTEQPLELVLDGLVEGVLAVDLELKVLHLNLAAARFLGLQPEKALGSPISDLTDLSVLPETIRQSLEFGCETTAETEIEGPANQRNQILEFEASPLRDRSQKLVGVVISIHDITELRHLEKVRRDFVANVSHELKTPITAIRGLIETILGDDDMEEETQVRFLEKAHSQALRLSVLVTDLLTLARLESRDAILEPLPFDLREPIFTSIRASRSVEEHRAALEYDLPKEPVIVRGDPESLRLVASNLLDNALKYTPEGGRIWVRLQQSAGIARLEVQDTGLGIAPKDRERIFERFYRVDKARSRELGGTGLGLSIVKHVCLAHGGRVEVASEAGKGSTFTVVLPLADPHQFG